ncbi:hypothetical protein OEZ85_000379 [Tetradesmus obliquus]|uniref:Uncharacterized protein n=1 Tax=Tetradesmus obliquus TaxID=3088 RepID=A0ABY8UQ34_TETOB|nr:hypothetical protein OEZ85_000379 [Tetradesmus obliquus]
MIRSSAIMAVAILACLIVAPAFIDAARPRTLLQNLRVGTNVPGLGNVGAGVVNRGGELGAFARAGTADAGASFRTTGGLRADADAGVGNRGFGVTGRLGANGNPSADFGARTSAQRVAGRLGGKADADAGVGNRGFGVTGRLGANGNPSADFGARTSAQRVAGRLGGK